MLVNRRTVPRAIVALGDFRHLAELRALGDDTGVQRLQGGRVVRELRVVANRQEGEVAEQFAIARVAKRTVGAL